tara:strand:+ start:165 stop:1313 length:1149 start_codon:yes stop_codon:yes gene_type:complete
MTDTTTTSPNPIAADTSQSAVPSLDSIAAKMTAMRETTLRNQIRPTEQTATGSDDSADDSNPVAPEGAEVANSSDDEYASDNQEADAQETVSSDSNDSNADELIDFLEFTETNPNAKFKFMRNGKEVIIDAKKAAAILGQGSAIHEEARQLKIERSEFDEYMNEARAKQDGLNLAMEFTIQPKLQGAYDEIVKTQNYQTTFQQQMARTQDPAARARIQASMQHNEEYIRQQQGLISQLAPAVNQFKQLRSQQVSEALASSRKNFTDKELKNEYVYKEVREKIAKVWPHANKEMVPGVANIDLISSDEGLLSLIRDGLRYRDKPSTKSAGSSMAALTSRKGSSQRNSSDSDISKLREQAKGGDKKAADNLLMQRLQSIRGSRR